MAPVTVTPNVDRLLQVVGKLTLYPERHRQQCWLDTKQQTRTAAEMNAASSCGTAGCVAGWAAIMFAPDTAVYAPGSSESMFVPHVEGNYFLDGDTVEHTAYARRYVSRSERLTPRSVRELAKEYLGISESQASWLFGGERNVKQILAGIKLIIERPSISGYSLASQFDNLS